MAAEYVYVHTATETQSDAQALARGIIQAGLAASVQIAGPVSMVTRWESALEEAQEWQLRITTTARCLPALERHIVRTRATARRRLWSRRLWVEVLIISVGSVARLLR